MAVDLINIKIKKQFSECSTSKFNFSVHGTEDNKNMVAEKIQV